MCDLQHPFCVSQDDYGIQRKTANLIIEIMNRLMYEGDYESAMLEVLSTFGKAIRADRLYILEIRRRLDSGFVELCAEGVPPRIAAMRKVSDAALGRFVQQFKGREVVFAANLDELGVGEQAKGYFRALGVTSLFSLPLRVNGRAVGVLGADNYELNPGIDFLRLIENIGPCMATVVSNHQLLEELEWSGTHDELTGLLNRRGVDRLGSERLDRWPEQPYTLGLVDIDDFKTINDVYGHSVGDEALKVVARLMSETFPPGALLGRNGGDELLVMLFGEDTAQADALFGRFAESPIEFESDGKSVALTLSIGFASYPEQADSLASAYKLADAALYAVKLSGKAQAMRYSDRLDFRYRSQLGFTPRDIAENTPGGIMVHRVGGNGEILFANKLMAKLLGCRDLDEFMDHVQGCFRYVVHPDDNARTYEEIVSQASLDDIGAEFYVDYRVATKDGSFRKALENGRLVEIEGVGLAIYAIVIDYAGHGSLLSKEP